MVSSTDNRKNHYRNFSWIIKLYNYRRLLTTMRLAQILTRSCQSREKSIIDYVNIKQRNRNHIRRVRGKRGYAIEIDYYFLEFLLK